MIAVGFLFLQAVSAAEMSRSVCLRVQCPILSAPIEDKCVYAMCMCMSLCLFLCAMFNSIGTKDFSQVQYACVYVYEVRVSFFI